MDIEQRIARIERVLQAVADGTAPWKAARAEFGSVCLSPDAIIPIPPPSPDWSFTFEPADPSKPGG